VIARRGNKGWDRTLGGCKNLTFRPLNCGEYQAGSLITPQLFAVKFIDHRLFPPEVQTLHRGNRVQFHRREESTNGSSRGYLLNGHVARQPHGPLSLLRPLRLQDNRIHTIAASGSLGDCRQSERARSTHCHFLPCNRSLAFAQLFLAVDHTGTGIVWKVTLPARASPAKPQTRATSAEGHSF
jgi:hypothetical protein